MQADNIQQTTSELIYQPLATPKVAMIVLSTDSRCEADFHYLRHKYKIDFATYVNRIRFANPITEASLSEMLNDVTAVVNDILPGEELDAVVFNCTSASAILGEAAIMDALPTDAPLITTAAASVAQIKAANLAKVDLLCPYDKAVSTRLADYFESQGVVVNSLSYMNIADDRDIARLTATTISQCAKEAASEQGDGLFISCTNTNAVPLLDTLTNDLGKPVFSSNFATFNQVCTTLGLTLAHG